MTDISRRGEITEVPVRSFLTNYLCQPLDLTIPTNLKMSPISSSASAMHPFVSVDGVTNFRDIGGYVSRNSAVLSSAPNVDENLGEHWCIRPGFLFRAAQPSQITPSGIEMLTKSLAIQTIFDFRSESEIQLVSKRYPNSFLNIPGTTRYAVPVFQEGDYSPVSLAKRYGVAVDESNQDQPFRPGFVTAYEAIARNAAQSGSFRAIMQYILQDSAGPVLFHCTVGKDRTGVFSALILKLCGVADEDIVADYALTTEGLGVWREHLIQRLLQRGETTTREQAEAIISSDPRDMRAFLSDVVEAKFGGARNYFVDLCGLQEDQVDQVISKLVIPKPTEEEE
jgi:protein tyrosine/serine phosphatase